MAMTSQKQERTQSSAKNRTNSRDDAREETTPRMMDEPQQQRTIKTRNERWTNLEECNKWWAVRWCWSHCRESDPSRGVGAEASHATTAKKTEQYDETNDQSQSGLMMIVNKCRSQKVMGNLHRFRATLHHTRQEHVCVVIITALQEEILLPKVLMIVHMTNQIDGRTSDCQRRVGK